MRRYYSIALLLFTCLAVTFSFAEVEPRDGGAGGGVNPQTQLMLQQLGAERTRLNTENKKLKSENEKLEKELKELKEKYESARRKAGSNETALAQSKSVNAQLTQRIIQTDERMKELIGKAREIAVNLRDTENANAELQVQLSEMKSENRMCAKSNVELSQIAYEVLDRYENKGMFASAAQVEPFTQLKRVQIENLVEDYTYAIEDLEYQSKVEEESANPE